MHQESACKPCPVRQPHAVRRRERGVRAVVILTGLTMVVEIVAGYLTNSMALLADGWHMGTHVVALGIASIAYALARRFATHRAFAFGTGKIPALAGYTSAIILGVVALAMGAESISRLLHPRAIDFAASLPVAAIGLLVNLASIRLLRGHAEPDYDHLHEHDHNYRAALLHVMADALTSALAIIALLSGLFLGWAWMDPAVGIIGAVVILKWALDLCRRAAFELLDAEAGSDLEARVREALESMDDVRVSDLHVWPLGRGLRSCVVTVVSATPRDVANYRERILSVGGMDHLTVEVRRCT
jgi:cation diffusion facilitator family transporter